MSWRKKICPHIISICIESPTSPLLWLVVFLRSGCASLSPVVSLPCMWIPTATVARSSGVICTNQSDTIITKRSSGTRSSTSSKWEPLVLQSPGWLQGFLTLRENNRHTCAQKAVSVFSERGRGRLIKSLTPRSIHFYCVALLTSAWKGMLSMGHTHVYILLSRSCVLPDKVITAFYCFSP